MVSSTWNIRWALVSALLDPLVFFFFFTCFHLEVSQTNVLKFTALIIFSNFCILEWILCEALWTEEEEPEND